MEAYSFLDLCQKRALFAKKWCQFLTKTCTFYLVGTHSIWAAQCIKVDMVQWNFLGAWLLFFWWNWIPAYIWMEIEKLMQFFSSWMFGLLNNDIEWRPVFKTFLMWYWAKERTKGREGMLEIAILILQDISNVMLGTTFLAMPPPDICLHARLQGVKELQVAMMNIIIIIWCCYTSLLMRASDALKTNIFLSTIGNVRERGKSSITTILAT